MKPSIAIQLQSLLLCFAMMLVLTGSADAFQRLPKDSSAAFSLKLNVDSEDGHELEKPYLLFTYRPDDGQHPSTRSTLFRSAKAGKSIQLPVKTSQVVVVTDNHAPAIICFDKELKEGESIEKSVTLEQGVAIKFRVLDGEGKPLAKAIVKPRVQLNVGSEFSWKGRSTNERGEVDILFPTKSVAGKAWIRARTGENKHANFVANGETVEIKLSRHVGHAVQVLDSENKPVANARVCHINIGSRFTRRDRNRPLAKTDRSGRFKIDGDPTRPLRRNFIVEGNKLRGVFSDVLLDPKKTITLKMPKPRTIKFTFTGDPKVIQGKTLRVSNGLYDDKRRLYYMWLPYHINADRTVLTVHGVLDGWLSVSADGVKGNYFWSKEIENKLDEISIDLNQHKRHTRKFRIAFEHEGKPVQPEGHVSFYVRTRNKSGTKYEGRLEDGIAEVEGEYSNDVRTLRIVHQGLKGYSLDTGADGSNVTVKLKPIEELDSGIAENIVVPVKPAGRIVGTVLTAEGLPMEGHIKCNYRYLDTEKRARPYGFSQSIKVDDKGRFELSPAPMDCEVEMKFGQFGNSLTKKFVIDSSSPVVERTIRLPKTQPASIEILLPTGEPAKNVRVKLFRKDDRSKKSTGRTDRNGVLKIPRLAVDQRKNYQYQVSSPAGSLRMPIASIEPGDALKVTLKTAHRMAGRITNKFGVPVSNMFVEAVAADGKVVDKAMSDAYGKFELSRLPGKSVRLRATHVWADAKVELTQPYDPTEVKKEVELKAIDNRPLTFNNDPSPLKVARLSESFGIVKHNTVQ